MLSADEPLFSQKKRLDKGNGQLSRGQGSDFLEGMDTRDEIETGGERYGVYVPLPPEWVTVSWGPTGAVMVVWCGRCRVGEALYATVLRKRPEEAAEAVYRHEGCGQKMAGWSNSTAEEYLKRRLESVVSSRNPWLKLVSKK